jgi:chorismate mutase/prephenate dehydratase
MNERRQPGAAPAAAERSDPAGAELERLRREIDAVDDALLERLNARAELVREVGRLKAGRGAPVYDGAREREIVARLVAANPGPFPNAALPHVFREIISATRSLEAPVRVAYLGPEGTFCHQASRRRFGASAEFFPQPNVGEVFVAVERGRADFGVVPVENSTEGVVTQTLDALAGSTLSACGEVVLPISHQLLSRSGRREDVRRVASHPQAAAQCREWIERELPGLERVETASTAAAARLALEDPGVAAIASALAGEVYGLSPVAEAIEDRRDNTTRFLVLGRDVPGPSGRDLTSAVFTVRKDEAGALVRLLEPFASHGVNLTAIHCRPMKGKPWEYLFFVDLEGHRDDVAVAGALAAAAERSFSHRVLGSFARATGRGRADAEGAP